MSLFKKRPVSRVADVRSSEASAPYLPAIDSSLPPREWFGVCSARYEATYREHYGSPETFAEPAKECYGHQEFGLALLYYQKALDLLHTLYVVGSFERRTPSPADLAITDGFVSSVGATLAMHPGAPVDDSVREATHRLRTIATSCEHAGLGSELYCNALRDLAAAAPTVSLDGLLR